MTIHVKNFQLKAKSAFSCCTSVFYAGHHAAAATATVTVTVTALIPHRTGVLEKNVTVFRVCTFSVLHTPAPYAGGLGLGVARGSVA